MKGEQLHNLIISLSQSEKNQITRYLNRSVNPDKICVQLYRTLADMGVFDEKVALEALYPGQVRRRARFESSCDYLAQLIVTALAAKDPCCFSQVPFIQKACDKKLFKTAFKALVPAMKSAWKLERLPELYLLSLQARELSSRMQQDPWNKAGVPGHADIFKILHHLETLNQALGEFRVLWRQIRGKNAESQFQIESVTHHWITKLEAMETQTQQEKALKLRILVWCHLLQQSYPKALVAQRELVDLTAQTAVESISARRIKETGTLLRLLYFEGDIESATTAAMQLRSITAPHPREEGERMRYLISAGFVSALCLGNENLGVQALKDLKNHHDSIEEDKLAKLYYYASQFCAYTGDWSEVLRWINELQKLPQKIRKIFTWQLPVLQAVAAIELGDLDQSNTHLVRLRRLSRSSDTKFPRIVGKGLSRLLNVPLSEGRLILAQMRDELNQLLIDPSERRAASYFDLRLWIDSRLRHRQIQEIAREQQFEPYREFLRVELG